MGDITSFIDLAQVCLYLFFAFFVALVLYLRREDKREGYPLLSDRSGHVRVQGYPNVPKPKSFRTPEGHTSYAPETVTEIPRSGLRPTAPWPGAPLTPTGNPLVDGVGPAAWANRMDEPELTWEGEPAIVPLSIVDGTFVDPRDRNPIGMPVYGVDRVQAGTVREIWTDRSEPQIRYLEVELSAATGGEGRRVLLPMGFTIIDTRRGVVTTNTLMAHQFAEIPGRKNEQQITKLEEDKITGYFAGGLLYATPARLEPLL